MYGDFPQKSALEDGKDEREGGTSEATPPTDPDPASQPPVEAGAGGERSQVTVCSILTFPI